MNKKSKFVFLSFVSIFTLLVFELIYIDANISMSKDTKNSKSKFIEFVGLPDLAISTEASYVRHRSMSNVGDIYKDDGSLREYSVFTYAISNSHIGQKW